MHAGDGAPSEQQANKARARAALVLDARDESVCSVLRATGVAAVVGLVTGLGSLPPARRALHGPAARARRRG